MPDPERVEAMFARIAGRYDLLNRVLSMGIDRRWRRRTVRAAGAVAGEPVLDVCCGTGDLSADFARAGARVLGVDFTAPMLRFAGPKLAGGASSYLFAQGDALRLPVRDGSVAVASVAFGLRNLADADSGLRELARVVRPGGRVLVLEFTTPRGRLLGSLYRFYFTRVLP
ncbi:MAG: ubiquinone/menaquinone biosynthesis methyltransferase, partial [Acidimicrobiia bacterium]|nr:ubiquinone/menaquinone biosynthesis methyltransferase [Acidimicrobiia bacterium]